MGKTSSYLAEKFGFSEKMLYLCSDRIEGI
jgi:hypothetical protein